MVGLFHAQGAAESDASVRLRVRSHVPGTRRDWARAEEAAVKKFEIRISNRGDAMLTSRSLDGLDRGRPCGLGLRAGGGRSGSPHEDHAIGEKRRVSGVRGRDLVTLLGLVHGVRSIQ